MNQAIEVPTGIWDKLTALLDRKPEPEKVEVVPEDYEATKLQAEEYKTKLDTIEREQARGALIEKYETELKDTKANPEMAELLADVPEDKADAILKEIRALSAQIDATKLTEEEGVEGAEVQDPQAAFNAIVLKYSAKEGISYVKAFDIVKAEKPDLFAAFASARNNKEK